MVDGNSVNPAARMFCVAKVTVPQLLADAGQSCAEYHIVFDRELQSKRVPMNEIWSFCGCNDKAIENRGREHGSDRKWSAIDADSKQCVAF